MTAKWGKHPDHNRWHIVASDAGGRSLCGDLQNVPAWVPVVEGDLEHGIIDCAHCVAAYNASLKAGPIDTIVDSELPDVPGEPPPEAA